MRSILDEMDEYARLPMATRRYIVKALDFGLKRGDFMARWAGSFFDTSLLIARADVYGGILDARRMLTRGSVPSSVETLAARCAKFDLQNDEMHSFPAFSFLYERLFGPPLRPLLANLYSTAATSPDITPEGRASALAGITMFEQTECDFEIYEALFFPEWDGD